MLYKNYLIKRTSKYGAPCWGVYCWESGINFATGEHYERWQSYPAYTAKTQRECKEAINCHFGRL